MPRTVPAATALVVLIAAAFASNLQGQVSPEFNVSISPSIVTVTQGSMTSFIVNIVVNERPQFEFTVSGLPGGVVAQVTAGHPGANTIVLTALPSASIGTFNVHLTTLAGNNPQTQSCMLNVKPLPLVQWEYQLLKAQTEDDLEAASAKLGQQSWELISVVYRERGSKGLPEWTGFFKRQKRSTHGD
jgi:hypothetical protein